MTDSSEAQKADAWNPIPQPPSWVLYLVLSVWTVGQPLLDFELLSNGAPVTGIPWMAGCAVIVGVEMFRRYREAAPYRFVVAATRAAHPDSLVVGIRLDPLMTPIGVEWGDSWKFQWGTLRASRQGVEIVKSDGAVMMDRSWDEIELNVGGLNVLLGEHVEEWRFQPLGESGTLSRRSFSRLSMRRFVEMQAPVGEEV